LILDFATIFSPDTVVLRLLIFVGRIFSILSDYVPDHTITYDELVFQSAMLAISTDMFLKKFRTTLTSLRKDTSFQDRRMFKMIFHPAGFSFSQYRSLLSLNVLEWVQCKPGQFIFEDESSILITYKGSIQEHPEEQGSADSNNSSSTSSTSSSSCRVCQGGKCYDIIGNITQAYETLESRRKGSSSSWNNTSSTNNNNLQLLRAGPSGGTFLRINMKALHEKVGTDADITESIKNIYFNAMQRKLSSYAANKNATNLDDSLRNDQVNKTMSHQYS